MAKRFLYFFLLAINVLLLQTCKKYEDGGYSIFHGKKIFGKKVITLYIVDGIDSLKYLEDSVFACNDYYIDFTKETTSDRDDKGYYAFNFECNTSAIKPCLLPAWGGNRKFIWFTIFPSSGPFTESDACVYFENFCGNGKKILPPFCGNWEITKLTWKELWIEKTKNNHSYVIHFTKKK